MNERKSSMVDSARRLAELRQGKTEPPAQEKADGLEIEPEEPSGAFSLISADRQQKLMVEFRLLGGDAKARAYSYLVGCDLNPSKQIEMDFSGYKVVIEGRNLRPLYDGLVAQRVAVVREMDPLHADANLPAKATVVTSIKVTEVK